MLGLDEQVVVVAHEAVVVYDDAVGFSMRAEELYKIFIIITVTKDYALFYSSVDDVVSRGYRCEVFWA